MNFQTNLINKKKMITQLDNLITSNLTQNGSSDRITGAELRQVCNLISNLMLKSIGFSTAIPFDSGMTKMPVQNISGPVAFSKNTTNQFAGGSCFVQLVADGVNTPDFSAFKIGTNSSDFDNRVGILNCLFFFYDGTNHWLNVWQEQNAQPIDTVAPSIQSAIVTNSNPSRIELIYSENLANITPANVDYSIAGKTISLITVTGTKVYVDVTVPFVSTDVISISYTSGTNKIQDVAGNIAINLVNYSVTNNIAAAGEALVIASAQNIIQSGSNWLAQGGSHYSNQNAIATKKIANGQDGYIITDMPNSNNTDAVLGLRTVNTIPGGYTDFTYGHWVNGITYYWLQPTTSSGITKGGTPEKLWLGREGGVLKSKRSIDGGTTWQDLKNWGTINGDLFIVATINNVGNSIFNPIGYGLQNA